MTENNLRLLHVPRWQLDGTDWHLIVGNRSVARLIPQSDSIFPRYKWLSIVDGDVHDYGWNAVDFETLDMGKYDIEQWWLHACRGEAFEPSN